jgi:hypothetical protein
MGIRDFAETWWMPAPMRYVLSEAQLQRIAPLLPGKKVTRVVAGQTTGGSHGRRHLDARPLNLVTDSVTVLWAVRLCSA